MCQVQQERQVQQEKGHRILVEPDDSGLSARGLSFTAVSGTLKELCQELGDVPFVETLAVIKEKQTPPDEDSISNPEIL